MPLFTKARSFLRNIFSPHRGEADLDREVQSYLQLLTDEKIRAGMPPIEARCAARIELGGTEQVKEQVREQQIGNWLRSVLSDFRFGFRQLRKNPGFTAVAVLTLALGIAVNATMFSLVSAFMLRHPPGRDPKRVAVVTSINPGNGFLPDANPVSIPNFLAWRGANQVFADIAAADQYRSVNLTPVSRSTAGQPQAIRSAAVSPNYFSVLGVSPELGRTFNDDEIQPGRNRVVILSHELWERQFASDASLIGRAIRLNREDYTVIGVMPSRFHLTGFTPQLWTPLEVTAANQTANARKDRSLLLFARLKPGVTIEQARAEFSALARRAEQDFPEIEKGWGAAVRTFPDFLLYNFGIRNGLAVVMSTVAFVLLIACANVAGLLLARAAGRRKELAIRLALGAGGLRIIRQLLTENLLIAFLGGALGLLLAYWGIAFVRANMNFNEAISAVPLSLDSNVLLFALAASTLCALLCGLAPALNASRTDVNNNLKEEGRSSSSGHSHSRLRATMVTCQIAVALFLLIGTGLLFRGIFMIEHQNLGFRADHLLTANVVLDDARYKDANQHSLFVRNLITQLVQLPGVEAASATSDLPATGPGTVTFRVQGQPEVSANQQLTARDNVVTTDFFRTAGIPLLRGRAFTEQDTPPAPRVVVVNQEFVNRHFHDQNPLGKRIQLNVSGTASQWSEIVGVVGNVKTYSEAIIDDPQVYEPFLQRPISSFSLMLKTGSDPSALASPLRAAVAQLDAELPLANVMSMSALIDRQKGADPFFVRVLASFAFLALILAAIGIYGLVAYSVGQRTHEIAIRMALGAKRPDVLRMILRDGMKMAAIGAAVGLALAVPLPRVFDAIFYGLRLREPRLYFLVPMTILVVALLATYIPARRASRVDPMSALHQD
jgi:putative ABC transport system permease protein